MKEAGRPQTLIIEDHTGIRDLLEDFLSTHGFEVHAFSHPEEALRYLDQKTPDWVLLDLRLPNMNGLEVFQRIRERFPSLPVVIMTAYADLDSAIHALRLGATDYLRKPFELKELLAVWERIQRVRQLDEENRALRQKNLQDQFVLTSQNPQMQQVFQEVEKIARVNVPVLILGESGTGKEVLARYIHNLSPRARKPFVPVNVTALPSELVESELFGYKRGAFSGADRDKPGLFQQAHGGTLFLDEIGDFPLPLQPKLLRVLDHHEITPLGSVQPERIDVRVIAATNRDLEQRVASGSFREDLYFRLNVITFRLPPLRQRLEDLPLLVEHFLHRYALEYGTGPRRLSPGAWKTLQQYPWPGNIRELAHVLARAVLLSEGEEIPESLILSALKIRPRLQDETFLSLQELERRHITRVLNAVGGDKRRAAQILGIDLSTLYRKLRRYQREHDGDL